MDSGSPKRSYSSFKSDFDSLISHLPIKDKRVKRNVDR